MTAPVPTLREVFGTNVRSQRIWQGLTQQQLGERLGYAPGSSTVADCEAARWSPTLDTVADYAAAAEAYRARLAQF